MSWDFLLGSTRWHVAVTALPHGPLLQRGATKAGTNEAAPPSARYDGASTRLEIESIRALCQLCLRLLVNDREMALRHRGSTLSRRRALEGCHLSFDPYTRTISQRGGTSERITRQLPRRWASRWAHLA